MDIFGYPFFKASPACSSYELVFGVLDTWVAGSFGTSLFFYTVELYSGKRCI